MLDRAAFFRRMWVPSLLIGAISGALFTCSRERGLVQHEPERPPPSAGDASVGELTDPNSKALAQVAKRVIPAVVSVASTRVSRPELRGGPHLPDVPFFRRFFGPEGPFPFPLPEGESPLQSGLGSGVIVGKDVIVTNAHVVQDARDIVVTTSDKRVLTTKVAGSDPKSDIAVLKVTGDAGQLTPLEFADSSSVELGQIVLAVGQPFGLGGTVTMGIISAKGRANLGIVDYEDFIQTDAAINPGNSGGALVDLTGKLVGVPTAILSRSGGSVGVGFAIPSDMVKPIVNNLLEHGRVSRGFLGVTIQDIDQDLAKALGLGSREGVLIADVNPGSPAEKAGIRRGDVALSVGGRAVTSTGAFRNAIAAAGSGATVELELSRNGKRHKVTATLTAQPNEPSATSSAEPRTSTTRAGMRLAPLDAAARQRLEIPSSVKAGAWIEAVEPASPAARAGLRAGDVILEIDKKPVNNPEDIAAAWRDAKGPVAVSVLREGRTFYAVLKPD
jgi:serine protease Do